MAEVKEHCPIEKVDSSFPPTILVHGLLDTDVSLQSSERMYRKLRAANRPCELHIVKDRGHAFDIIGAQYDMSHRKIMEPGFSALRNSSTGWHNIPSICRASSPRYNKRQFASG